MTDKRKPVGAIFSPDTSADVIMAWIKDRAERMEKGEEPDENKRKLGEWMRSVHEHNEKLQQRENAKKK